MHDAVLNSVLLEVSWGIKMFTQTTDKPSSSCKILVMYPRGKGPAQVRIPHLPPTGASYHC